MRKFWNFTDSGDGDERILRLDGAISDETWWGDEVTPEAFKSELYSGTGDISVWINSCGGCVFAAAQIYNALKEYSSKSGKVTVKIDGIAASAASVVAMAGDSVLMSPVSYLVIHNPATIAIGDSEEMLRAKEMLDEIKQGIINAYEVKTKLPRDEISRMMSEETTFNAKSAVLFGFADGILYENEITNKIGGDGMNKMVEMLEKRAKIWDVAKNFLESKRDESGTVSDEDKAVYEKMEADVNALTSEIELLERQQQIEASIKRAPDKPIRNNPTATGNTRGGTASDTYGENFWNLMRGKPYVQNDLSVGTDSKGGYLVPDEFERTLVESLEEHNIMRQLAHVISTSSGELQIPVVATKGTASWINEAEEIPTSDAGFSQATLSAYKLGTMIRVSQELLDDSAFALDSFIAKDFGRRIGVLEEEAFIAGDGVNKPTGFLVTAPVGVTAESEVTFDDIMDLYHSLKSPYRSKAVFITNDLTVKSFRKLKDANGQYIWQPAVTAGTPDTILGRPVYTSGFMPVIGAGAKVMAFGDFSYYWIADRKGRFFKRLDELFASTDQVGFKATQRVDGKLILPETVKVLQIGS